MIELKYNQARKVCKLIKDECCNCIDGNCVLLDDACVQLISQNYIYCNYFLRAVLPLDSSLHVELCMRDAKRCEECGKHFVSRSNRQKYCNVCSPIKRNEYMRNLMRKKRIQCQHLEPKKSRKIKGFQSLVKRGQAYTTKGGDYAKIALCEPNFRGAFFEKNRASYYALRGY